jgi:hypothetical protein
MTATPQPESKSSSRRAMLAGALGGLGALAASAIGRASLVRAGVDGDVVLGGDNTTSTQTSITITGSGDGIFVSGAASGFVSVTGQSTAGNGVHGQSSSGTGVQGQSSSGRGVWGYSLASDQPGSLGVSFGNSTGVLGYSGANPLPAARAKTGVYGYAPQDTASRGVTGESPAGIGVYGKSSTGYGVYSSGKVYTTKWYELTEISAPAAPIANRARLFARVNGVGKTQLCVRFQSGAVQVIKTEP